MKYASHALSAPQERQVWTSCPPNGLAMSRKLRSRTFRLHDTQARRLTAPSPCYAAAQARLLSLRFGLTARGPRRQQPKGWPETLNVLHDKLFGANCAHTPHMPRLIWFQRADIKVTVKI